MGEFSTGSTDDRLRGRPGSRVLKEKSMLCAALGSRLQLPIVATPIFYVLASSAPHPTPHSFDFFCVSIRTIV